MEDNNLPGKMNVDSLVSDDIEIADTEEPTYTNIREGYQKLPSGQALSLTEIYHIKAREKTTMIVLVGPSSSGKTTIETVLYQLFLLGEDCGFFFAGSQTIQGYQDRAHYSTTNSNEVIPTTPRTARGSEELFLHLRLLDLKSECIANYLFADISGEEFQANIADVNATRKSLSYISQANHIVFVLDGERLTRIENRNGVINEMNMMIRTLLDAGLLTYTTKFQLVISKFDTIKDDGNKSTESFIQSRLDELCNLIKMKGYNEVSVHKVAAMPHNKKLPVGFGLNELLATWRYKPLMIPKFDYHQTNDSFVSEFNKLSYKLAGDVRE